MRSCTLKQTRTARQACARSCASEDAVAPGGRVGWTCDVRHTGVCKKTTPLEKKTLGNIGFRSPRSEQSLPLDCMAKACAKELFFFHRHRYVYPYPDATCISGYHVLRVLVSTCTRWQLRKAETRPLPASFKPGARPRPRSTPCCSCARRGPQPSMYNANAARAARELASRLRTLFFNIDSTIRNIFAGSLYACLCSTLTYIRNIVARSLVFQRSAQPSMRNADAAKHATRRARAMPRASAMGSLHPVWRLSECGRCVRRARRKNDKSGVGV